MRVREREAEGEKREGDRSKTEETDIFLDANNLCKQSCLPQHQLSDTEKTINLMHYFLCFLHKYTNTMLAKKDIILMGLQK